ncbi:MAG: hypothetical protein V4659_01905, partial [Pseudomonadota bacterium]
IITATNVAKASSPARFSAGRMCIDQGRIRTRPLGLTAWAGVPCVNTATDGLSTRHARLA